MSMQTHQQKIILTAQTFIIFDIIRFVTELLISVHDLRFRRQTVVDTVHERDRKTVFPDRRLRMCHVFAGDGKPVKTEKAKLPVTNTQPIENKKEETKEKRTVKIPDLTIKKLQESISKIDHKNNSKEKYMLKLMEEVGELAKVVNEDVRMKDKEIKGTIEEELQDVLYYVTCLANIYGIDLEECIYLKEELNCKKYNRKNMFKD